MGIDPGETANRPHLEPFFIRVGDERAFMPPI